MAKSLTRLSTYYKNVSTLHKFLVSTRLCQTSTQATARISSTQPKGVGPEVQVEVEDRKQLFDLIKNENNPGTIIANLEANKSHISGSNIIMALGSMQKFYQENAISTPDLMESPDFKNICRILNNNLIKLEAPHVVKALKIFNQLQVPSSTMIMQSLLQLIRHFINDLSMQHIFFLSFLLKHMEPTHLSRAIATALPEVFKAQFELKLDKDDIKELKNALWFASSYLNDTQVDNMGAVECIIKKLNSNQQPLDVDSALEILWSLSKIKHLPRDYIQLLDRVHSCILDNANLLTERDVMNTFSYSWVKLITGVDGFYNHVVIDRLLDRVVTGNYGFVKGTYVLNKLNKLKYINFPLLNYLSTACYHDPSLLSEEQPLAIHVLVTGLAFANYKPPCWPELQKIILEKHTMIPDIVTLSYFALRLAALDCFDSRIFEKVFSSEQRPELTSLKFHRTLRQLYQTAKTLYPEYSGPWPSEELVESFTTLKAFDETKSYPLLPALEKFLGGSSYVRSNVITNLGHEIDHLIIMEDECPLEIESTLSEDSSPITFVDDLDISLVSERVAVLAIPPEAYGKNIQRLDRSVFLNKKSLEAMSYTVILVSIDEFMRIPENEVLPYVEHLLKTRNMRKDIMDGDR